MAKKRTPEQEAIRRAMKMPDRRAFSSRYMSWAYGAWPCRWGVFSDWTSFSISFEGKAHGAPVPGTGFVFKFGVRPFSIICFWEEKRIFWVGDWEWKRGLRA